MAIRKYKPTSAGRRSASSSDFAEVTTSSPEKKLLQGLTKTGGRNNNGRITSRFRGGGHKRRYRVMDFKRNKIGVPAQVAEIEYDPNRSARIALLHYVDGVKTYILAPDGLSQGDQVISSNIEMRLGKGGQLVRSAGVSATLMAKDGEYAQIKLPSGEVRKIHIKCRATVGQVSNSEHKNIKLGKAGRSRWLGRRPHQRGVTMNPVDHPMGGGEGRTSGGRHPCSPWGQLAKGLKTGKNKRTDNMIVKNRKAR